MTPRDQVLPQFTIVIDFTVQNNRDGSVLVRDGLMTGVEVNDA